MQQLYFELPTTDAFLNILEPIWSEEGVSACLIGHNDLAEDIAAAAKQQGIAIQQSSDIPVDRLKETLLLIFTEKSGEKLSEKLLFCVDLENILVVAPITDWHFSKKPLFLVSIPKSGTHLIYELARVLGYHVGIENPEFPEGQTWYCVEYTNSHTVARDFFVDTVRRSPFGNRFHSFLHTPTMFIYRHPLDILVSEAHYYHRDGKTAFSGWLDGLDFEERVARLLNDNWLVGTLRDRIGGFLPWLDFPNVISLSFEELIGAAGGGNDVDQKQLIWSIQLKLQVPGDPSKIASHLFNPDSATFRSGQLGGYTDELPEHLISDFVSRNQDILIKMGYPLDGAVGLPVERESRRKRNIRFSKVDYEGMPITIESDFLGCNLVRYSKRIFAVPIAAGHVVLEELSRDVLSAIPSATSLSEIKATLLIGNIDLTERRKSLNILAQVIQGLVPAENAYQYWKLDHTPSLIQEDYFGYNLFDYDGRVWAAKMAAGPIDFSNTTKIEEWLENENLLRSTSIDGARAAVERLRDRRAFEAGLSELGVALDEKLTGLTSRLEGGLENVVWLSDERMSTLDARMEQREQSLAQRLSTITPESDGELRLLQEDYFGYNLFAFNDWVWAAEMAAGPIDLTNTSKVEEWLANGRLLRAATVDGVRAAVERLQDRRAFNTGLAQLATVLDEKLIALTSRLEGGLEVVASLSDERLSTMDARMEQREASLTQRLSKITPEFDAEPRLLQEDYFGYNLFTYDGWVWAVEMAAGPMDFANTIEVERWLENGSLLRSATIDGVRASVERLQDRRAFEAGLSQLGAVLDEKMSDLTSRLEERLKEVVSLSGERLSTMDARIEQRQASLTQWLSKITPESDSEPRLLQEDYFGYNLFAYDGWVWAVEMAAGPIDFANTGEVEGWLANGRLLRTVTVDGTRAAVERLLDRRAFEAGLSQLGAVLDLKLTALTTRLENSLQEVSNRSDERFDAMQRSKWWKWLERKKNSGEA
jgi:RNase H-fold protein (predicted Holliday junction resolvase)